MKKWILLTFLVIGILILLISFSSVFALSNKSFKKVCNQDLSKDYSFVYFNESPTDSMYPAINKSSIATIEEVTENTKLEKNDIILFKFPKMFGCLWVHRIIFIGKDDKGTYYITKGDNNWFSDFWQRTRKEDVYYKVTSIL